MLTPLRPQVLAVYNASPASTKTTTAIALAVQAARSGLRTLLIDLAPNGTATRWLEARPTRRRSRVGSILHDVYPIGWGRKLAVPTRIPRLRLIAASGTSKREARSATGDRLRLALAEMDDVDVVVIDCPRQEGRVRVLNALTAATDLIVTTTAAVPSIAGAMAAIATTERFRQSATARGADPDALLRLRGIVVTDSHEPAPTQERLAWRLLQDRWPEQVLEPGIPYLPAIDTVRQGRRQFLAGTGDHPMHSDHCAQLAPQVIDAYPGRIDHLPHSHSSAPETHHPAAVDPVLQPMLAR